MANGLVSPLHLFWIFYFCDLSLQVDDGDMNLQSLGETVADAFDVEFGGFVSEEDNAHARVSPNLTFDAAAKPQRACYSPLVYVYAEQPQRCRPADQRKARNGLARAHPQLGPPRPAHPSLRVHRAIQVLPPRHRDEERQDQARPRVRVQASRVQSGGD